MTKDLPMADLRKTDFLAIANILKDLRGASIAIATDPPAYRERRLADANDSAARSLAKVLERTSATYDARRFLAACGVKATRA